MQGTLFGPEQETVHLHFTLLALIDAFEPLASEAHRDAVGAPSHRRRRGP